jgi:hypothetical protein
MVTPMTARSSPGPAGPAASPPHLRLIVTPPPIASRPLSIRREALPVSELHWRFPGAARGHLYRGWFRQFPALAPRSRLGVFDGGEAAVRRRTSTARKVAALRRLRREASAVTERQAPAAIGPEARTVAEALHILHRTASSFAVRVGRHGWQVFVVTAAGGDAAGGTISEPGWYWAGPPHERAWNLCIPIGPYVSLRALLLHAVPRWLGPGRGARRPASPRRRRGR